MIPILSISLLPKEVLLTENIKSLRVRMMFCFVFSFIIPRASLLLGTQKKFNEDTVNQKKKKMFSSNKGVGLDK